jgi:hypothetical protein
MQARSASNNARLAMVASTICVQVAAQPSLSPHMLVHSMIDLQSPSDSQAWYSMPHTLTAAHVVHASHGPGHAFDPPSLLELSVFPVVSLVLVPPLSPSSPGHSQAAKPLPSGRQGCAPGSPPGHAHSTCIPGTQLIGVSSPPELGLLDIDGSAAVLLDSLPSPTSPPPRVPLLLPPAHALAHTSAASQRRGAPTTTR